MAADTDGRIGQGLREGGPAGERVATHLRTLIQRGRLKPGDRLPTERELAAELGVSRPSVRSALQQLSAMGVVKARRRAGTFIQAGPPALDSQPLKLLAALHDLSSEEIFEARGALEVFAAGLAARRATSEQRLAIADAVTAMFASIEDPQVFLLNDVRFHQTVAAAANNSVMSAMVDMVAALVYERRHHTIERASDLREAAQMHQRVYDAIRRRNAAAARDAMAEHLRVALEGWAAEDREAAQVGGPGGRGGRA